MPGVNAPESFQLPATFMLALGAVSDPVMERLLKELVLVPDIAVAPPNAAVPPLALNVPELVQLPDTFIVPLEALNAPPKRVNAPFSVNVLVQVVHVPLSCW